MLFIVYTSIGGTVFQDLPFQSSESIVSLPKFVLADTNWKINVSTAEERTVNLTSRDRPARLDRHGSDTVG